MEHRECTISKPAFRSAPLSEAVFIWRWHQNPPVLHPLDEVYSWSSFKKPVFGRLLLQCWPVVWKVLTNGRGQVWVLLQGDLCCRYAPQGSSPSGYRHQHEHQGGRTRLVTEQTWAPGEAALKEVLRLHAKIELDEDMAEDLMAAFRIEDKAAARRSVVIAIVSSYLLRDLQL